MHWAAKLDIGLTDVKVFVRWVTINRVNNEGSSERIVSTIAFSNCLRNSKFVPPEIYRYKFPYNQPNEQLK